MPMPLAYSRESSMERDAGVSHDTMQTRACQRRVIVRMAVGMVRATCK